MTFLNAFNAIETAALATEMGKAFALAGFKLAHTGGGCTAWERKFADGWTIIITDSEGCSHNLDSALDGDHFLIGAMDQNDDYLDVTQEGADWVEALDRADDLQGALAA